MSDSPGIQSVLLCPALRPGQEPPGRERAGVTAGQARITAVCAGLALFLQTARFRLNRGKTCAPEVLTRFWPGTRSSLRTEDHNTSLRRLLKTADISVSCHITIKNQTNEEPVGSVWTVHHVAVTTGFCCTCGPGCPASPFCPLSPGGPCRSDLCIIFCSGVTVVCVWGCVCACHTGDPMMERPLGPCGPWGP